MSHQIVVRNDKHELELKLKLNSKNSKIMKK